MSTWRATSSAGRVLLVTVLATGLTTFMFLPLLAIELTTRGLPVGQAGFLVGLLSFSGQGFSTVTGVLVDRFGSRSLLACGFTLRIVGYLLLGRGGVEHPESLIAGVVAIGVGGSMLGLAIKIRLVTEPDIPPRTMLALRATFVNVGVVAGPALGMLVYPFGFGYILTACVLSHLLLGFRVLRDPGIRRHPADQRAAETGEPAAPWGRWWHWAALFLVGICYWAIYNQLNVVVPIAAVGMTGSTAAAAVVFTVNGALVVLCQYTVLRHLLRDLTSRSLLALGFLSFAVAYAALVPQLGWYSLMVFVVPMTFAELLIGPSLDEQVIRASPRRRTGTALGVLSMAGAVGGLLGAGLGGWLMELFHGGSGVWITVIVLSVAACAVSLLLPKRAQHAAQALHRGSAQPS